MTAAEPSASAASARDALLTAMEHLGIAVEPETPDDYLALVRATADLELESRKTLKNAVTAARSSGITWATIGKTLGMSKQAAQKRFSTNDPPPDPADPNVRILGPVTAFDELRELALAGQYGWHSVEFGPYFHRVVHSDTQWEHKRVGSLSRKTIRDLCDQGWELVGSEFPYTYLKRDLGTPALVEPARS